MVFFTKILYRKFRDTPRKYGGFIDKLRISIKAGSGGAGLPRYGGIGGAGGNIYLVSKEGVTLNTVQNAVQRKRVRAEPGCDSASRGIIGAAGKDLYVHVPPGIIAYSENGVQLGELNEDNRKLLVAKGGIGGCKETNYFGQSGEARNIYLDLKLIADVGLVGFPNAGKSTFLSVISKAKPKIANYPFTTIKPQLGIVEYDDYRQISVADLPGLIEGAHANFGMGHKFLKHLERTKILLYIVDIQGFQLSQKYSHRDCLETVLLLNKEVELYRPDLLDMPSLLLVNKMDTENAGEVYEKIRPCLTNLSEYAAQCEPDLRPEKVLQFDNVLTASLLKRDKGETDEIKNVLRETIDRHVESFLKLQNSVVSLEEKLNNYKKKYPSTLT